MFKKPVAACFVLSTLIAAAFGAEESTKPISFVRPDHPFMLVSPEELATAKAKIKTQPWAADSLKTLCAKADEIVANPQYFPESEGGWTHKYVSPKTAGKLEFDPKSPHRHLDPATGEYLTGKDYDDAWNSYAISLTTEQLETLATVWTLTGDRQYAETMRKVFLDIAKKYPTYRLHDKSMKLKPDNEPVGKYAPTGGYLASQSIDECNVFTSLAFSYDTLAGSGFLSDDEQKLIEKNVWQPCQSYMWRLMELHASGGNWLVWNTAGAVVIGVLMGDEKLVDKGLNAPEYGLLSHIHSGYINEDGFTAELSPGYYAFPLKALMRLAVATRRVGLDFYKEDLFRKALDLPLAIRQPDLHMPRLNDGWYITLADPFFASVYETAASWYDDPNYKKMLVSIYASKDPVIGRNSAAALLYGPAELPKNGIGPSAESKFLKASGLAVLRTPGQDWNAVLKNDRGKSGHRHPDALNLVLFANGEEVFPGTGSPSYGHPSFKQWFSQTIAHNTVTLNQTSQRISPSGKEIEFGYTGGGLSAVQSHASSLALQAETQNAVPTQLRRTLVMLPSCIVDVVRTSPDGKSADALPETTADLALHLNGKLNMDGTWVPCPGSLIPGEKTAPNSRAPDQGYDFIEDVRRAEDPSQIHGRLVQTNGGCVDLWFASAPEGGQIYTATGLGLPGTLEQRRPMILQRRQTNETVFAAVYAPWKDAPQVKTAMFPPADGKGTVAIIEHTGGVDVVLSLPEPGELSMGGVHLKGTLAVNCAVKGGRNVMLIGQSLQADGLSLELESAGAVSFESVDGREQLFNLGETAVKGFVQTSAAGKRIRFELAPSKKLAVGGTAGAAPGEASAD